MPIQLTKEEIEEAIPSVKKFFQQEFEQDLSDLRARFLLEYFQQELAPLAYNQGVKDAEQYFRRHTEDLTGICFEAPMTYWTRRKK